jgi:maleylacetate reductase
MDRFVYEALSLRVIVEREGLLKVGQELDRLGARRVLLISTPSKRPEAHVAQITSALIRGKSAA